MHAINIATIRTPVKVSNQALILKSFNLYTEDNINITFCFGLTTIKSKVSATALVTMSKKYFRQTTGTLRRNALLLSLNIWNEDREVAALKITFQNTHNE